VDHPAAPSIRIPRRPTNPSSDRKLGPRITIPEDATIVRGAGIARPPREPPGLPPASPGTGSGRPVATGSGSRLDTQLGDEGKGEGPLPGPGGEANRENPTGGGRSAGISWRYYNTLSRADQSQSCPQACAICSGVSGTGPVPPHGLRETDISRLVGLVEVYTIYIYLNWGETMKTAKIFRNGQSQAVRCRRSSVFRRITSTSRNRETSSS